MRFSLGCMQKALKLVIEKVLMLQGCTSQPCKALKQVFLLQK